MTDREAIAMALKALEYHQEQTRPIQKTQETIDALRQALAQPTRRASDVLAEKQGAFRDPWINIMKFYKPENPLDIADRAYFAGKKDGIEEALSQPEQGCAECGKKASDGWALYCVKCTELFTPPEQEPVAWVRDLTSPQYLSIADTDCGCEIYSCLHCPTKQDVNQELVEALQEMVSQFDQFGLIDCEERAIKDARSILAKHKEQE